MRSSSAVPGSDSPPLTMTDSKSSHDPDRPTDGARSRRDDESPPPTPRWVRIFAIIAILLILAFLISHLAGGGFRGHSLP